MHRLLAPFRGLRWKLTLSYTLVTVGALLAVEIAAMLYAQAFILSGDFVPRQTAEMLVEQIAPRAQPYLEASPPDTVGLNVWLREIAMGDVRMVPDRRPMPFIVGGFAQGTGRLLVVDAQGVSLAGIPAPDSGAPAPIPGVDDVLRAALAGERDVARLYARTADGQLMVAAPVRAEDGRVLGALVFNGMLPDLTTPYTELLAVILNSAILFTLIAGAIGTLFGWLTARYLTRRLDRVAQSAAAWGRGDFAPAIGDASADELGQLARRLDAMAHELEELIVDRQQLATLEERNRLARDLHDSVKQQAFAISMNLGAAQAEWSARPDEARAHVDSAAALARQAQQELSALIQTLRPVQLDERGLAEAVREYAQVWTRQSGIATICQVEGAAALSREAEQALFRVAQEALANVARHSGATAANVTLQLDARGARLEIRDNGRGFDATRDHAGLGLRSMRERVAALGGTLEITSRADGTRVRAEIPLTV